MCNDGDVRLVGGASEKEGRVEICINNIWGTVCDDRWTAVDAGVVCRQLNYFADGQQIYMGACFQKGLIVFPFIQSGAVARTNAYYGAGLGPIFLDEVYCIGSETSLLSCLSYPLGSNDCQHTEDAGVTCAGWENCSS